MWTGDVESGTTDVIRWIGEREDGDGVDRKRRKVCRLSYWKTVYVEDNRIREELWEVTER